MRTVFDSIEETISHDKQYLGHYKPVYRWDFPRQSGITSYLINRVTEDLLDDKIVMLAIGSQHAKDSYLNANRLIYDSYHNKQLYLATEYTYQHITRGRTLDSVYADGVAYWSIENQQYFIQVIGPTIDTSNSYILMLNTTGGEFIPQ